MRNTRLFNAQMLAGWAADAAELFLTRQLFIGIAFACLAGMGLGLWLRLPPWPQVAAAGVMQPVASDPSNSDDTPDIPAGSMAQAPPASWTEAPVTPVQAPEEAPPRPDAVTDPPASPDDKPAEAAAHESQSPFWMGGLGRAAPDDAAPNADPGD